MLRGRRGGGEVGMAEVRVERVAQRERVMRLVRVWRGLVVGTLGVGRLWLLYLHFCWEFEVDKVKERLDQVGG